MLKCYGKWIIAALVTAITSEAKIVRLEEIPADASFLQIGLFSKPDNLKRIQKRLEEFPLWLERRPDATRVFVVLTGSKSRKRAYINKVKKIVPDAFIRHAYHPGEGESLGNTAKRERTDQVIDKNPLDAEAILRTRKRFF